MNVEIFYKTLAELFAKQNNVRVSSLSIKRKSREPQ